MNALMSVDYVWGIVCWMNSWRWRWVEDGSTAPQQEVGEGIARERCGGKRKSVITPTINGGHVISFQICAFTLWQKTTGSTCSKSSRRSCWDERGPRSLQLFFPPQLSFLPSLQGQQLSKGAQEHRVHWPSLQPCYEMIEWNGVKKTKPDNRACFFYSSNPNQPTNRLRNSPPKPQQTFWIGNWRAYQRSSHLGEEGRTPFAGFSNHGWSRPGFCRFWFCPLHSTSPQAPAASLPRQRASQWQSR